MSSSGSACSANVVKPRRSQKATVISPPMAGKHGLPSGDETSCAICGDRKRPSSAAGVRWLR